MSTVSLLVLIRLGFVRWFDFHTGTVHVEIILEGIINSPARCYTR